MKNRNNSYGKITKFFLSLFFVLLVLAGIWFYLYSSGMDVVSETKQWTTSLLSDEQTISNDKQPKRDEKQLQETINQQQMEISKLKNKVQSKDESIIKLKDEIAVLKAQLAEGQQGNDEKKAAIEDIAEMYANMAPQNAAAIMTELSNEQAAQLLEDQDNEARALILENLPPKKAAQLTVLLTN